MFKEFKAFIARGNVLDLAVAVIIGKIFGGLDFSSYFVVLGKVPPTLAGSSDYAALKKAGVPLFGYGAFVTAAVNFLIVAFIIFLIVRAVNRLMPKPPEVIAEPVEPTDVTLLREIRDELKKRA